MNQDIAHNLFSNFQSTIFRAVRAFLKHKAVETDKSITTTLRIPGDIKEFYECIAEAEMTSINTAIVSTLSKVKDQTISEYQKSYTKINDTYDYQINSFLKIIDNQKIDYNDLCALLEWITGNKVSRIDITNKEKLVNLIDKKAQTETCRIFGYSYDWIGDNKRNISYRSQRGWYKNVQSFVRDLIINFYLDETVESFELSFLCCDRNVVNNIISGVNLSTEENITPIVIVNRCINDVKTSTFHQFESNNINYEKCRKHFIVLINMILMLVKYRIINFPNGYLVTPQQHDLILDGSMHLAELFNKKQLSNGFNLDDLQDIEPSSLSADDSRKTKKPTIYHCLNWSVLDNILAWSNDSPSIALTNELASRCHMNKIALAKYLRLFTLTDANFATNDIFLPSEENATLVINLVKIRELRSDLQNCKILDTSFG